MSLATTSYPSLNGAQKAAVLLLQVGQERSAKILRSLRQSEMAEIMGEIARLRDVDAGSVSEVLEEFRGMAEQKIAFTSGGLELAKSMLEATLGEEEAREILDRVTQGRVELPFEFLHRADPRQILSFIENEHPQTITLVLAHIPAERAALILSGLPEDQQRTVAHRLATMDRTSPDVIEQVEHALQRRLSSVLQPTEMSAVGGVQTLVDILNRTDRTTERLILETLERDDPELAEEVRQRMFVFEDIVQLDDRSVQLVLRQVDSKELAVALKGVRAEVRQLILRNMSERAAQNLSEEIELLGAVRLKSVEEAQGGIVRIIRSLEESGQLLINRGADEFVE